MLWLLFGVLALLITSILLFVWLRNSVLVGRNEALIIFGRRYQDVRGNERAHRIVKHGTVFVRPYKEHYMRLSLEPWTLHLRLSALDATITVEARARVRVNPDTQSIYQAIELGLADDPYQAEQKMSDLFQHHFHTLLESFSVAEAVDARKHWIKLYQEAMQAALLDHGLILVWLDLYKLTDSHGYMHVTETHEQALPQQAQAQEHQATEQTRIQAAIATQTAALPPVHQAAQELLHKHPELVKQIKPEEIDKPGVRQSLIKSTGAAPDVIDALIKQILIEQQINQTEYIIRAAFDLLEKYPELADIMTPANFQSKSFRQDVVEATGSTPEVIEMLYSHLSKQQSVTRR